MVKQRKDCFILQLRLKTERWQEDIIDSRLEAGRKIYNALASKSLKLSMKITPTRWNLLHIPSLIAASCDSS